MTKSVTIVASTCRSRTLRRRGDASFLLYFSKDRKKAEASVKAVARIPRRMKMTARKRDIVIAGYSKPQSTSRPAQRVRSGGEALGKVACRDRNFERCIDGLSGDGALSECPQSFFAVYMTEAWGSRSPGQLWRLGGCSATEALHVRLPPLRRPCEVAACFG